MSVETFLADFLKQNDVGIGLAGVGLGPVTDYANWRAKDIGVFQCEVDTRGISPDDVKVELKSYFVLVHGETKYDGESYSVDEEIALSKELISNLDRLEYKTLNGITYIYAYVRTPEVHKIIPKRI